MACRGADELFFPRKFPFDGPSGLQRGEHAEILAQHLLLAAKPAADPLGDDGHVASAQAEDVAELLLGDERRLRAGADMDAPVGRRPRDRAVCFEMYVLRARGGIDALMHYVGVGQARRRVADLAMDIDVHVAVGGNPLVV